MCTRRRIFGHVTRVPLSVSDLAIMRSSTSPGQLPISRLPPRSREAELKDVSDHQREAMDLLLSQWRCGILLLVTQMAMGETRNMKRKRDVQQGTLALMVLSTLEVLGSLHGYGIARRIEQISGEMLSVNQGTLYPVLLKLEQEGAITSEWASSENNRRARFYRLTRAGQKLLEAEKRDWEQGAAIIAQFFEVKPEDLA
jgi:PadR family transcriptional regulator PadR